MKRNAIILTIATLSAVFFVLISINYGISVSTDSIFYMELAESYQNGNGFKIIENGSYQYFTYSPPLYPIVLSFLSHVFSISIHQATLIVSVLSLFLLIVLLNVIFKYLSISTINSILFTLLFVFSPAFSLFFTVLTEHIFAVLWLLLIWVSLLWKDKQSIAKLIFLGIISGFILLLRNAGIGIILGIMVFLWINSVNFKQKIKRLVFFSLFILLLYTPWLYYTFLHPLQIEQRNFSFHPVGWQHIKQLIFTLLTWISTYNTKLTASIIMLIIVLVFIKYFSFKNKLHIDKKYFSIAFIPLVYLIFLFVSITFIDYNTPLDSRILLPVYLFVLIALAFYFEKFQFIKNRIAKILFTLILILNFTHFIGYSSNYYQNGANFSSKQWKNSEIINYIKQLPDDKFLYSNAGDALDALTNKDILVFDLPQKYNRMSKKNNLNFDKKIQFIDDQLSKGKALVVYFNNYAWRSFNVDAEYLLKRFANYQINKFEDGFVISFKK